MSGPGSPTARAAITAAVPDARYVRAFDALGWENFADPLPGSGPVLRRRAERAGDGRGSSSAPWAWSRPFMGDADATGTVDALLPLWFALVKQNGGNRKVALRIVR